MEVILSRVLVAAVIFGADTFRFAALAVGDGAQFWQHLAVTIETNLQPTGAENATGGQWDQHDADEERRSVDQQRMARAAPMSR